MPSFSHPYFLLFLFLVPPLLVHYQRRGRAKLLYSDIQLVTGLPKGRSDRARWGGLLLRALGLVSLIVALAGPRWPDSGTRVPTEGIAIAIVLDVSASMNDRDFIWQNQIITRLEAVKKVFHLFVQGGEGPDGGKILPRPQDLISLVTFGTRPDTACPLTLDHQALLKILDAQEARTLATEATTNPGDAIAWALSSLRKAHPTRKVLILLTDGESNVPPPALTPRQSAQLAGNLDIPIYAIGAGNEFAETTKDGGTAEKARKSLEEVARISKGQFFLATDGKGLADAFDQIDKMERTRILSFQYRHYHEGFAGFAVMALISLLLVSGLECTRWRRVP